MLDANLTYWMLLLSVGCVSCLDLKVAFGHLNLNDHGVPLHVVNWLLLLPVG